MERYWPIRIKYLTMLWYKIRYIWLVSLSHDHMITHDALLLYCECVVVVVVVAMLVLLC